MAAPVVAVEPNAGTTAAIQRLLTGEELYRMSGLGSNDLIRGEIVERMPTGHLHGDIEFTIGFFLKSYLRKHKLGKLFGGETGVYTGRNPDTVRGVDVAYMSYARYERVQSTSYLDIAPELIVKIMSPQDTWTEVQEKLVEYFAIDVKVVWVVDPKLKQIHVFHALEEIHILRLEDDLTCEDLLPGFSVPLTEIFDAEA
ncbi:MAG: Uma2 family endonuclease [Caldilineaceae bacterium]